MRHVYICDATRTPIGRYGGTLSSVRTDDLAAIPLRALLNRNSSIDPVKIDEVVLGAANQAGEDNRNVARMALLLAGFPKEVPGITVNRLCASGMEAVSVGARMIKSGEADLVIAGGVESMSRAPIVMPKANVAFSRKTEIYDTTVGWRFVNKSMHKIYGTDSMPETAENVAERYQISRYDQDLFAMRSQKKAGKAISSGRFSAEITSVTISQPKGESIKFDYDEHPRPNTTQEQLAKLPTPFKEGGTVTAGNASGVNDGAAALVLASEVGIKMHKIIPRVRIVASAAAGVEPSIMGMGPVPAVWRVLKRSKLKFSDISVIELNEAFSAQAIACLREWGLMDDDIRVNPNGGAIALGHPLGMSGARLLLTAVEELIRINGKYGLCTLCVGVGQGSAMVLERV